MRKFYIFNINREFAILTKELPYNLYKTLEELYYLKKQDYNLGVAIFEKVAIPIDKKMLNLSIFNDYKDNQYYTKFNNLHMINNYYSNEQTTLAINKAFLTLETTTLHPAFLKELDKNNYYFACDFKNKDYFWLSSLA